jgi:general secretion pathway protein K
MTRSSRGGFVMVAVLGILVLFAGLLGALTLLVRTGVDSARIVVDDLEADALTRAGLELSAYQLFVLKQPAGGLNGQQVRLDSGTVTVEVASETGRIDLNHSDPALIASAYAASGLKGMPPEAFAAVVTDWRDVDSDLQPLGAETGDYQSAGLDWGPQNDDFRSVDELQWLPGVKRADVVVLARYFTVANPVGTVNLFDAPREVLAALPKIRPGLVERIIRLRANRTEQTAARLMELVPEQQAFVSTDAGTSFRLRLAIRPDRAPPRTIAAVIVADGTGKAPYRVVSWERE